MFNWLFFWTANFCPARCPPESFSDNEDLQNFQENEKTSYKLFNQLQIKYYFAGSRFESEIIRRAVGEGNGTTQNPVPISLPFIPNKFEGRAGPFNGRENESNEVVTRINEGTPDVIGVSGLNTVADPLMWNMIGSIIEAGVPHGTGARVCAQVYPTYFIYQNEEGSNRLVHTKTIEQAPNPIDNFNDDPYHPLEPTLSCGIAFPSDPALANCGPAPFIPPDLGNCVQIQ